MKYLSFAGGLDSGDVQLTCNNMISMTNIMMMVTSSMSPTRHLLTLAPGLAWVTGA